MVECPSVHLLVCLSRSSTAAAVAGGLDAERTAGRKYRSIVAGAQLAPVLTGKRGQRHVEPTEEVEHRAVCFG